MKIGIFTDTYHPQVNGVVTSIQMLERELTARGHSVYIFTTTDPKDRRKHPRVFRLPSIPFVFLPSMRMTIAYPPALLFKLRKLNLDVIHTQTEFPVGIFGKLVSKTTRTPLVHTYHTMYEDYVHYIAKGHLIKRKTAQSYSRIFCNSAQIVIAPVEKAKASLRSYGVVKPIEVIPTGIDFEPFRKYTEADALEARRELGIDAETPVVVYVGRVAREKNIDVVIKQFSVLRKELPRAKLVIVGGGPYLSELVKLTNGLELENSVVFAGVKPWAEIGKYYKLGDIFITASTSETQGLTYIEAMASGTPVVAKLDKSVEDVLTDGETGYTFADDDQAAAVMHRALTDPEGRAKVAETALASIGRFSSSRFAESLEDVYIRALMGRT